MGRPRLGAKLILARLNDKKGRHARFKCTVCDYVGEEVVLPDEQVDVDPKTGAKMLDDFYCPVCRNSAVPDYDH